MRVRRRINLSNTSTYRFRYGFRYGIIYGIVVNDALERLNGVY